MRNRGHANSLNYLAKFSAISNELTSIHQLNWLKMTQADKLELD